MANQIVQFIRNAIGISPIKRDTSLLCRDVRRLQYENRRFQLSEHIIHDNASGVSSEKYTDYEIVVSLTTYGKRINDVAYSIESIMQQTLKANRITLWLDRDFQNRRLPQSLLLQQKRGLEIYFCEDIRSYTKLIPALANYPNDAIVTIDDDLIYDIDVLERLIIAHIDKPNCIHASRVHRMRLNDNGRLLPYREWHLRCMKTGIHKLNFLTGVGGVLYPPHCFDDEVFNQEVFLSECKYADDVWFNAMAIKKGIPINKVPTRSEDGESYLLNDDLQAGGLNMINIGAERQNDVQIESVFSRYDLYRKLR